MSPFGHTTYTKKNGLKGIQWRYIEMVSSCNCSLISVCAQNVLLQYMRIGIQTVPISRVDTIYMQMLSTFKLKFSCVNEHTHTCTYICIHMYKHSTCIHTYEFKYVHTYLHTYVYIHTYIHTYIQTYTRRYVRTQVHTYIYIITKCIDTMICTTYLHT